MTTIKTAAVEVEDLDSVTTLVFEGLKIRGLRTIMLTDADSVAAWGRLQATFRPGPVRHGEPDDLALVLAAIGRFAGMGEGA